MSMRYYAYEDYGLVLNEETRKTICEKVFAEEPVEDEEYGMALYEAEICQAAGNFTGETFYILDNGRDNWDRSETYDDDSVYYIPVDKYPTLFRSAYNDVNEMIVEFRKKIGEYLPEDFDYRSNIRHIVGTTWG